MMKKITFLLMIFTFSYQSSAQEDDFEGIITYRIFYQSKDSSISTQHLYDIFGDTAIVYIKGSHYKYLYHDSKMMDQGIYDPRKNMMYMFFPNNDTVSYSNCDDEKFEYSFQSSNDTIEILGYNCKSAEINSKQIKQTYYYTNQLKLKNADFHNHVKGGYNLYWSNTKSIYLKVIVEYKNVIETRVAIDIQPKKIKEKEFKIPSKPLKKL